MFSFLSSTLAFDMHLRRPRFISFVSFLISLVTKIKLCYGLLNPRIGLRMLKRIFLSMKLLNFFFNELQQSLQNRMKGPGKDAS